MKLIVLFGLPAAGKGTLAKGLCGSGKWLHLSCGDLFRHHIRLGTPFGLAVRANTEAGIMTPCVEAAAMLFSHLDGHDGDIVLDGFPRTYVQSALLHDYCLKRSIQVVGGIEIYVDHLTLLQRALHRLYCRKCGRTYHHHLAPPAQRGVCDADGEDLHTRSDDAREIFERRVHGSLDKERQSMEAFASHWPLASIDGRHSPDMVLSAAVQAIGGLEKQSVQIPPLL